MISCDVTGLVRHILKLPAYLSHLLRAMHNAKHVSNSCLTSCIYTLQRLELNSKFINEIQIPSLLPPLCISLRVLYLLPSLIRIPCQKRGLLH